LKYIIGVEFTQAQDYCHWLCGGLSGLNEVNLFRLNLQGVEETTSLV